MNIRRKSSSCAIKLLLLFTVIWTSCSEDEQLLQPAKTYPLIDPEIIPFVQEFMTQGKMRGIELSVDGIPIVIVDSFSIEVNNPLAIGYAFYNYKNTGTRRIEIIKASWIIKNDIFKEKLIFHELGHIVLNRPHTDKTFPNGHPASIMNGLGIMPYRRGGSIVRDYYIDELFNKGASTPEWANPDTLIENIFSPEVSIDEWRGGGRIGDFENNSGYQFYISVRSAFPSPNISYLALSATNHPIAGSSLFISNTFQIIDFVEYSSLKLTAEVKPLDVFNGTIKLQLRTMSREGTDYKSIDIITTSFDNLKADEVNYVETILYFPAKEIKAGSVRISFEPNVKSTILVNNVKVGFWK